METSLLHSDTVQAERRGHIRHKVFKGGTISFNNGYGAIECIVRNLSDDGALLTFGETTGVPNRFALRIGGDLLRNAEIRWRSATKIGVALI